MNKPLKVWVTAAFLSFFAILAAFASQLILDDFDCYPDASDGSPNWETSSIFWEMSNGEFISRDVEREFALRKGLPPGREMSVEVSLTIRESVGKDWCIAGVCIYIDETNFWHLALIKQPVSMGGQHYAELREMLDGTWIAEFQPETKLTQLDNLHPDFHWVLGQRYRLKIDLLADRIVGEIFDSGGKLCFRQSYRFDNRAVVQGFPALDNGGFLAQFDNFKAEIRREGEIMEKKHEPRPAFNVAAYGDPVSKPTGYFRAERIDGRDWLITPDGRRFLILGTDHASYRGHWCEKLGYAPYHKKMIEAYGSEEKWAEDTTRMLRSWGFNALGAGHSEGTRYRGLAHTEFLSFGSGYAGHDDIVPKVHWTGFPNVFSPKFREYCEKRARDVCAPNVDNPWLIGYFIDNELEWYGKSGNEWGLFEEAMKKPPEHTAKKALIELLKERHGSIDSLNETWNTDFADWRDVSMAMEVTAGTDEMIADAMAFVALCADRYFGISADAIRKYDPNHLILGSRFAGRAPESVWRAAGKYCDIVSLNIYPRIDMETGIAQGVEEFLAQCHELTGKPLFITEWSFPALDSGLPCRHGAGMRVDTQAQRAYCVAILQELFLRQPFVIGSDFFMWVDEPALGISSSFPEDSNYGLVNEDNQPYEKLVETLTQVHSVAYEIHEGKRDKSGVTDRLKPEALESILIIEQMPKGTKPVEFKRTPVGYEIDNGVLKMIKESDDGRIFDRIELSGIPVGDYLPMIWAKSPDNSWVTPTRIAQVRESMEEDGSLVLEVIAEREKTMGIPYKIGLSIVIPPATSWFASKLLWVENTGDSDWRLEGYLHYTRSNIGDDPDDEVGVAGVPNYWLPIGAWYDRKLSIYYGVMSAPMSDMNVHFWKDEYGQHPDAVVPIRRELNVGARLESSRPFAFIYAVRGDEADRPWLRVYAQIRHWLEPK